MGYLSRKLTKEALRKLEQQDDPELRRRLENKLWNADCFILYDQEDRPKQQPVEEDTDPADDNVESNDATEAPEQGQLQKKKAGSWPTWSEVCKQYGQPAPEKGEADK